MRQRGFTALDVMIAVVVMGLVGVIIASNWIQDKNTSIVTSAKYDVDVYRGILDYYYTDYGFYPSDLSPLIAHTVLVDPEYGEPYMKYPSMKGCFWEYEACDPGQYGGRSYSITVYVDTHWDGRWAVHATPDTIYVARP